MRQHYNKITEKKTTTTTALDSIFNVFTLINMLSFSFGRIECMFVCFEVENICRRRCLSRTIQKSPNRKQYNKNKLTRQKCQNESFGHIVSSLLGPKQKKKYIEETLHLHSTILFLSACTIFFCFMSEFMFSLLAVFF